MVYTLTMKKHKQRHITFSILAIMLPWLVLLIKDEPLLAIIALILQSTIIGWIPGIIWAWRAVHSPKVMETNIPPSSSTEVRN